MRSTRACVRRARRGCSSPPSTASRATSSRPQRPGSTWRCCARGRSPGELRDRERRARGRAPRRLARRPQALAAISPTCARASSASAPRTTLAQLAFKTGPGGLMDVDFLAGGGLLERGARDFPAFPSVAAMLACTLPEERTRALLADYGALRVVEARARWVAGRAVEEIPAAGEGLVAIAELVRARARAGGAARPDPRAATAHPRRLSGGRRRRDDRRAPGLIDASRPVRVPSPPTRRNA